MAEFKVLLVEDAPESVLILQSVLEFKEFKWVLARNSQEATTLLQTECPHLLVVDISLGPEDNGLTWLTEVRKGPFAHIPAIVMTSSAFREDVERSISLHVDDYIVKPADHGLLSKKIHSIRKRLREQPSYRFVAGSAARLTAQIQLNAKVRAISETGLCLSSGITNRVPLILNRFDSELFEMMEVPRPKRVTLLNNEREIAPKDNLLYRNYCQVQGWQEKDLQKIRLWMRRNKLGSSF